jgi:hypothetical protein
MRAHWYVDEEGKAMQDALWKMSAAAQAEAVRSAEVSAVELVDSHLDRIAEVNPQVNAVTQLLAERAREAAAQTDRQRAAGEALGPLAGVPFTVKESTAVEGVPTTFGTERYPLPSRLPRNWYGSWCAGPLRWPSRHWFGRAGCGVGWPLLGPV